MPTYRHGQFSIISLKGKMSACVSRQKGNPTISQTFSVNISLLFFTSYLTIYMFGMHYAAAGSSNVVHTGKGSFIPCKKGISDFRKQFFNHK